MLCAFNILVPLELPSLAALLLLCTHRCAADCEKGDLKFE